VTPHRQGGAARDDEALDARRARYFVAQSAAWLCRLCEQIERYAAGGPDRRLERVCKVLGLAEPGEQREMIELVARGFVQYLRRAKASVEVSGDEQAASALARLEAKRAHLLAVLREVEAASEPGDALVREVCSQLQDAVLAAQPGAASPARGELGR